MRQTRKIIPLTFTEYEQYPDREYDDEICFHATDGRWITSEDLNEYLSVALREAFESMKTGDTLQITLKVQSSDAE